MTTETEFDPAKVDLSVDRVNALLDELVAEKGEYYVYPRSDDGNGAGSCVNVEMIDGELQPSLYRWARLSPCRRTCKQARRLWPFRL